MTFRRDLAELINRYSRENESNTPDFMLAEYLIMCLSAFNKTIRHREEWHERDREFNSPQSVLDRTEEEEG